MEVSKIPNHVKNKLRLSGEQSRINKLLDSVKGEDTVLDFNKIIPMPESLKIESGKRTEIGLKAYCGFIGMYIFKKGENMPDLLNIPEKSEQAYLGSLKDMDSEQWELGKTAFLNQIKYSAPTWYEWAIENWGTKWSAYDTEITEDNTIEFNTAWSNAFPIISELAYKFPNITFEYRWADEELGANVGMAEFTGSELVHDEYYNDFSREAYEFAADLWGLDLEEMGYVFDEKTQTYEHHDPEEQVENPTMN